MHQENLDYKKHCQHTIRYYVIGHDEPQPSNTNAPRGLDCIYLSPVQNQQGGHELLHLQTNEVIKRRCCTPVPLTPLIIKQVHALAELDNMPKGLKITKKSNVFLFDSAWIAGVDYDDNLFDDEDYSTTDETDSDETLEYDEEDNDIPSLSEEDDDDGGDNPIDNIDDDEIADILNYPTQIQPNNDVAMGHDEDKAPPEEGNTQQDDDVYHFEIDEEEILLEEISDDGEKEDASD